jgi:energy-coupling factor transporter ATP-binding protein EcfA2
MKITGIDISDHRQFKNAKFDFTYPANHKRAGQPMDKVCFIGQSGTGKTTLLNIFWDMYNTWKNPITDTPEQRFGFRFNTQEVKIEVHIRNRISIEIDVSSLIDEDIINITKDPLTKIRYSTVPIIEKISQIDKHSIFIKDSIAREADAFLVDQDGYPKRLVTTTGQAKEDKASYLKWLYEAGSKKNIVLGDLDTVPVWLYLLNDVIEFDESTIPFLLKLGQNANASTTVSELQAWLAKNPRLELAKKCLDPILEKFFLEISPAGEAKAPLALRTKAGVQVPNKYLSTGTRQILATAIPIYKFDTEGTVILFDEPERSLFPDVQRELVEYYTGLAPTAQFFFATHSPIIAASFEPCERFILYFDENGEVKCRNGVAPVGDDPNDVLRKDFGMNPLVNEKGTDAFQKYLDLTKQAKNEPDMNRRMDLLAERAVLGNQYNFPATLHETN